MEKLKQKLSSRKLWAAVASALLCVIAAFYGEKLTPEVVEVLKYAVAAGVTYIFGEGIVDVARQVADAMKASAPRESETAKEDPETVDEDTETNVVFEFDE